MMRKSTYAEALASCIEEGGSHGCDLGPTDAAIVVEALRQFSGRAKRRLALFVLSFLPALFVGVGLSDFNGDGQDTFADLIGGVPPARAETIFTGLGAIDALARCKKQLAAQAAG